MHRRHNARRIWQRLPIRVVAGHAASCDRRLQGRNPVLISNTSPTTRTARSRDWNTSKELSSADGTTTPKLVVNVPASIGDNFGGWDGDRVPEGEKYISHDGTTGRMAELIQRGEPAVMFGHWAGLYSNGSKHGLTACKKVITTMNANYRDRITWMKSSEMARYWAARELTRIDRTANKVSLAAPFACPAYTVRITGGNCC